ncbi:MAG: VOC family protein [candidate division Zixibacteria bacterium]|nr:VOC family protein [candidate division Zixibacteria bacterium]
MLKLTHSVIDIAITCSHFEESLHFYKDLLGLEVVLDIQIPGDLAVGAGLAPSGFRQVRVKAGDTLIKLMQIDTPPSRRTHDFAAGVRWLTFFVENIRETYDTLKADGVKFLTEPAMLPDDGGVVCAIDPDGVLIEFVQG